MIWFIKNSRLKWCASSRCGLRGAETRDSIVLKGCKGQKVYKRSRPSMEHPDVQLHWMKLHFVRMGCCTRSCFSGAAWDVFHFRFASIDWRRATPVSELISIFCDPHHFLKMSFGKCLSWARACTCNSSFSINQPYEASIFVAWCHIGLIVSERLTLALYVAFVSLSMHLSSYDTFFLLLGNIYASLIVLIVTGCY